jgi:hypothetical protein
MPKNLFLLSLATITLAVTTITNVASSRADTVTVIPPSDNSPRACAAVVPAPPGCASPSTPSNSPPVTDRFHSLPYPSYPSPVGNIYIPQYPYPLPVSSIPISPFPYPHSPKPEPPATQPGDCINCVYGTSAK